MSDSEALKPKIHISGQERNVEPELREFFGEGALWMHAGKSEEKWNMSATGFWIFT